ncbi:MAG: hypothetical protein FWB90_07715 [Fibromonadales bacterium]|nr:hypothetical protein [Fibromonadales bacterium]
MKKVFALSAIFLFSCTSETESPEKILEQGKSSSSVAEEINMSSSSFEQSGISSSSSPPELSSSSASHIMGGCMIGNDCYSDSEMVNDCWGTLVESCYKGLGPDPNAYPVPEFTCEWEPNTVISGDNETEVKVNFTAPSDAVCDSPIAWTPIWGPLNQERQGEYVFSGKITPKFGEVLVAASGARAAIAWPAMPSSGEFAEFTNSYATIACSGNGKPKGRREVQCAALKITKAPMAAYTGKIELKGSHTYSSSSIYYIGETPDFNSTVSATSNQNYCGEVIYEKTGIKTLADVDAGANKVKVVAVCERSGQRLDSAFATVVPNPTLSACTWKDDKTILAKGQEATPSASISNDYGRCGKVSFSNGFPKILADKDVGSINVTASADCGAPVGTITKSCPVLEVKSAIYELKNTEGKVTLPNETTVIEMDLPSNWKTGGTASFFCQVTRDGGNGSVRGTIGSGSSAVSITGNDYASAQIPVEWTINKYSLQVSITCGNICICGVGW